MICIIVEWNYSDSSFLFVDSAATVEQIQELIELSRLCGRDFELSACAAAVTFFEGEPTTLRRAFGGPRRSECYRCVTDGCVHSDKLAAKLAELEP